MAESKCYYAGNSSVVIVIPQVYVKKHNIEGGDLIKFDIEGVIKGTSNKKSPKFAGKSRFEID